VDGWKGTEVSGALGGKPSEVSGASPDGKASEVPEAAGASGSGLDGKPSEAGVPLTYMGFGFQSG
jgi:hypothetical protein